MNFGYFLIAYAYGTVVNGKRVKNFYLYYSTTTHDPIGISGTPSITLSSVDGYDPQDTTKATWTTSKIK